MPLANFELEYQAMSLDPTHIPDKPYDSDAVNRARNLLEAIPETVGPYRILERIGTGGMGEVYRAEQRTPIRREVALKLIKLGMDTKLVIARFEAERQALALMDHPHIAKVFDANADDTGRPYFVMEYVKGKPITEYADHQRLSIPERLELFEQVCQAVQHAHHKGVIHRDLKPSNVLVCTQDGKPFSKVIDFGVAKAVVQRLTEKTFFTEHGQFVGTPHYMSPEQADGSIDIDTRTDVYSLGVLLYELLTGSTPFASDELRKAAFDHLKRMVIEVDPPKPSTRLQSLSPASGRASALRANAHVPSPAVPVPSPQKSGEKVADRPDEGAFSTSPNHPTPLETLARHRSTEPKRLSILVRGELDWIVMKALEKDRKRRYETPSSLATDIRSHLTGGTVLAAPPSLWYRTQKFARKYRYALIATGTAFALLLLAFLGTTYGLRRARIAEAVARDSEIEAIKSRDQATKERDAKNEALTAEAAQRALADQQRELAERQLIDGLLRPIGYGDEPNAAELRSFVDWSQIPDARLKLRILDVAFENPEVALRLARRAERAMQACIGLSPTRRAKAIEIVTVKQRDMGADPTIRVAACWLALELGTVAPPALHESDRLLYEVKRTGVLPHGVSREFREKLVHILRLTVKDDSTALGYATRTVREHLRDSSYYEFDTSLDMQIPPNLPPEQVHTAVTQLINALESSNDIDVERQAEGELLKLSPLLSTQEAAVVLPVLVNRLNDNVFGHESIRAASAVTVQLAIADREEAVRQIAVAVLDYMATSTTFFAFDLSGFAYASDTRWPIIQCATPRNIGALMTHPGAVGEPREFLLQRFEELVFHDGLHVLLPDDDGERQGNYENRPSAIPVAGENEHGGLTPNRSPAEPPPRRFHSVHDAAAWIQQNWPDFDLEATHPVVWRGER